MTTTSVPVYAQLIARLQTKLDALGVSTVEKAGWVQLVAPNGHRIDVRKDKSALPLVDTTVSPEQLTVQTRPLDKPNGRVQCFVPLAGSGPQALATLEKLVEQVVAAGTIPPKKRGAFGAKGGVPDLFAFEQSLSIASSEIVQIEASDSSDD